jgi:hypothetical protein
MAAEDQELDLTLLSPSGITERNPNNPCAFFTELDTILRSDRWLHWSSELARWACQPEIIGCFRSDCNPNGAREEELLLLGAQLVFWSEALTNWAKRMEACYQSECAPRVPVVAGHTGPPDSPFAAFHLH